MRDHESTIRSRELGGELRQAMEQAKLSGTQTARLIGMSSSWVSRLLSGSRNASELRIAAFLAVCRITGEERDRLLALCQERHLPGWWQQHGSWLPQQVATLTDHEDQAVTISSFQSTLVPGLLQTGDYARAMIQDARTVPAEEIEDRVAARLARQRLFYRDRPARFTFYLHEVVLRLPIGGPAVMFEQLRHLLWMSRRPYLTLRVVPAALGSHAGIAGSFQLMEFAEFKPVAYLDSQTSCLFLEQPEEIAAYQYILTVLAETALNEGESNDMIAALATELYADREDHDDRA